MAKRDEYPNNKGIRARQEAVIASHSACRNVLQNIKSLLLENLSPSLRAAVETQIDSALEKAEIATNAIAGD